MTLQIFGVRHHGPGCARCVRQALDEFKPDAILLEGPADAQDSIAIAAHAEMIPPVALAIFNPDSPLRAAFYPFADFSPEWQVIRWAAAKNVPVRFMDLPQSMQMTDVPIPVPTEAESAPLDLETQTEPAAEESEEPGIWRTDPLAVLAEAAGYTDHELWWEEQIERRQDASGLFEAILEAMRAVRAEFPEVRPLDILREAFMRQTIRDQIKAGTQNIAVVCGAWHAPVLDEECISNKRSGLTAKEDTALLKGLPNVKTTATWIPWTYSRLAYSSGYGAGIASPGWYHHLWTSPERAPIRWMSQAAQLLRASDLDAPSASVIEAVRLADALAAIRELRAPGLAELNEAILTVICRGDATPLALVRQKLEVGDVLGEIPSDAPSVPLARDLERLQKSLRFKPSAENKLVDLDIRKDNDRVKSQLLHRLNILGIAWGTMERSGGKVSTFRETWRTEWKPEFAVNVVEANVWGNTVETAATAKAVHLANESNDLPQLTELLDSAILAGLPEAVESILICVQARSAVASDVRMLMDALPALARVARYGDVRGTEAAEVTPIIESMFERAVVGLPNACSALDDAAAEELLRSMVNVSEVLAMLARDDLKGEWLDRLRYLMLGDFNGLLRGWCCRSLLEQHRIDEEELYRITSLSLSSANEPKNAAAWLAGLLTGSGLLLLHQDGLWSILDRWLRGLNNEVFTETLPLLRRAFADFQPAERRLMGEKVKDLKSHTAKKAKPSPKAATAEGNLDWDRVNIVLPTLAHILGVSYEPESNS